MKIVSDLLRHFGFGRLAYLLIYYPIGLVKQSVRESGPLEQRRIRAGHLAMRTAALVLPPLELLNEGPPAEIHFLSGPKFWHQTLFCFVSLQLHAPFRITPIVHDDGRMDEETKGRLLRVVPWMRFADAAEAEARLDALLPEDRYPSLRTRRKNYPHLRKLTDIHVASQEFRLVADSDMLFFRRPDALLAWFEQPQPLYMQDVATAYGYPLTFLSGLAGAPVPEMVNVGLYAVDGNKIDWDCVEHWCRAQNESYGPSYFQEQALTAMLFAGREATALPKADYIVMPDQEEGSQPAAVLHHYVDLSKRSYFRHGWQLVEERAIILQRDGR